MRTAGNKECARIALCRVHDSPGALGSGEAVGAEVRSRGVGLKSRPAVLPAGDSAPFRPQGQEGRRSLWRLGDPLTFAQPALPAAWPWWVVCGCPSVEPSVGRGSGLDPGSPVKAACLRVRVGRPLRDALSCHWGRRKCWRVGSCGGCGETPPSPPAPCRAPYRG